MARAYVAIEDYQVTRTTEKAVAIAKTSRPLADPIWLPRSACADGDLLDLGDTDITVREDMAEEKELDF